MPSKSDLNFKSPLADEISGEAHQCMLGIVVHERNQLHQFEMLNRAPFTIHDNNGSASLVLPDGGNNAVTKDAR